METWFIENFDDNMTIDYFILQESSTTTGRRGKGSGWGVRSGTEDDKEDLNEIITAELRKTGNHGDCFCCKFLLHWIIVIEGLDEDLADAVDKSFYENYKTWKNDHPTASTRQQVNLTIRICLTPNQIRQWVSSWNAHLGDQATPQALVDLITKKGVTQATQLKDELKREFHLDSSSCWKLTDKTQRCHHQKKN